MNYTPPRGRCNYKTSMISTCECLRYMLHPVKANPLKIIAADMLHELTMTRLPRVSIATDAATMRLSTLSKTASRLLSWRNGPLSRSPLPEVLQTQAPPRSDAASLRRDKMTWRFWSWQRTNSLPRAVRRPLAT